MPMSGLFEQPRGRLLAVVPSRPFTSTRRQPTQLQLMDYLGGAPDDVTLHRGWPQIRSRHGGCAILRTAPERMRSLASHVIGGVSSATL